MSKPLGTLRGVLAPPGPTYCACLIVVFMIVTEIEALAIELQGKKKKEIEVPEEDRIAFGEKGKFDEDIYGTRSKFDGYYTTIAPNDDIDVST